MTIYKKIPPQTIAISIVTFALLVWSIFLVLDRPHIGAIWSSGSGIVQNANPDGLLQEQDVLLAIDGVPVSESRFPFFDWQEGDSVRLTFVRDGLVETGEALFSAENNTLRMLLPVLLTTAAAIAFWGVGLFILQFRDTPPTQALPFFYASELLAVILAIGQITHPVWLTWLTLALMWFITPAVLHLHLRFPVDWVTARVRPIILVAYGLAAVSALLTLLRIRSPLLTVWYYVWLTVGIVGVLAALVSAYRRPLTLNQRRQLGILIFSSTVALLPFLLFVSIPQILLGQTLVLSDIAVVLLIIVPVGYGYALARYQINRLEQYLSRSASLLLTLLTIAGIYLIVTALAEERLAETTIALPLFNLLLVLTVAILFRPLYGRLRYLFDYLFYGGQYDYPSVISPISRTLIESGSVSQLANALPKQLQRTMRVRGVAVILPDLAGHVTMGGALGGLSADFSQLLDQLAQHPLLQEKRPLFEDELPLLSDKEIQLVVPIYGLLNTIGVMLVGSKIRNDGFGESDLEILTIVAHQASIAFQNLQLIERLRQKIDETERYQRQLIAVRDEERKRIARDLHDDIIQELVGFRYLLANPEGAQLSDSLLDIIRRTRQLCYDLRPPALDFGLIPAIRSVISRFEMKGETKYELEISGLRDKPMAENTMICLFYCVQEALTNSYKHAQAARVHVCLDFRPKTLHITIKDDGIGFALPQRLGNLMSDQHFGLVGMRERIELIDGHFHVTSTEGVGTTLELCVPDWQKKEQMDDTLNSRHFSRRSSGRAVRHQKRTTKIQ